jgi:outer membrane protein
MQACAQRDRVIASYTLLSAIGRLDVKTLVLNTPDYLPEVHYHQVRDAWHGLPYAVGAVRERDAATDLKDAI